MVDCLKSIVGEFFSLYFDRGALNAKLNWSISIDPEGINEPSKNLKRNISGLSKRILVLSTTLSTIVEANVLTWLTNIGLKIEKRQRLKCEISLEVAARPPMITFNSKAFINRSSIDAPEDIKILLSFGWKFLAPYITKERNLHLVLAQLEKCIDDVVPPLAHHEAFLDISYLLKERNRLVRNNTRRWLNFVNFRTREFLEDNNKLIFATRSDKGSHTVLINISDYNSAISEMLNDHKSYLMIGSNDEISIQRALIPLISKENSIMRFLANNPLTKALTTKAYQPNLLQLASFYGLPKIHKETFALRPIVSMMNSPGHGIGTVFNEMLNVIFPRTSFHIKDSYEAKKFFDEVRIENDSRLVSFDVVSMFTNIPRNLVKNIVMKEHLEFKKVFNIDQRTLETILEFLLSECVVFSTTDTIYKQLRGLPMGGCISTALARIVMDEVMKHLFYHIPKRHISFIKIFVDDTIAAIHVDVIDRTLEVLNSFHSDIEFTIEHENKLKSINFLNLTIIRNEKTLRTNWYRKYFASGRLLNYFSSHKRATIMNTAVAFINTVLDLSDGMFFHSNKPIVEQTLKDSSFPESVMISLMNQHYTLMRPRPPPRVITVPFKIFPQAICSSRQIKKAILSIKKQDCVLADSNKNTKINFVKTLKYRIPTSLRRNVVIIAECVCKKKIRILSTGFNQNVQMATPFIVASGRCTNGKHIYTSYKLHKGLCYQDQTDYLIKYLSHIYRKRLDTQLFSLPNYRLAKLLKKTK